MWVRKAKRIDKFCLGLFFYIPSLIVCVDTFVRFSVEPETVGKMIFRVKILRDCTSINYIPTALHFAAIPGEERGRHQASKALSHSDWLSEIYCENAAWKVIFALRCAGFMPFSLQITSHNIFPCSSSKQSVAINSIVIRSLKFHACLTISIHEEFKVV